MAHSVWRVGYGSLLVFRFAAWIRVFSWARASVTGLQHIQPATQKAPTSFPEVNGLFYEADY